MEFAFTGQELVTFSRYLGAALAMGLAAIGSAMGIGLAAAGALRSMVLRPERQGEFMRTMFISQAVAESTAIYGLVVAMLLLFVVSGGHSDGLHGSDWVNAVRVLSAGLTMGLGAVGAGYGIGLIGRNAIRAMTQRPEMRGAFMRTMFLGMAITESPAIYALVISMILIFVAGVPESVGFFGGDLINISLMLGAGLAMGLGAIGAAVGIGEAGSKALISIARQPQKQSELVRTMFLSMAITESPAIYALVVSTILLFVFGPSQSDLARAVGGIDLISFGKYLGGALAIGFGTIGAGIGLGYAGGGALEAAARNPEKEGSLIRTMFLSMAITESPAIYALVISMILIFVIGVPADASWAVGWTEFAKLLGGGLAIGLGTIGAGLSLGIAGAGAMDGIARNPRKEGSLVRTMFLSMAVTESPAIYALVVSILLVFVMSFPADITLPQAWIAMATVLGGGLAIGLGSIGAGAGLGIAGAGGLRAIARHPEKEGALVRTMFIGMAVTESPTIYALVVSLILLFVVNIPAEAGWSLGVHDFARYLGAGIAMGAGAIGPGLGIGVATREALIGISRQPAHEGALVRTMFLGMAVTESTAIYALVVSLILLFAVG